MGAASLRSKAIIAGWPLGLLITIVVALAAGAGAQALFASVRPPVPAALKSCHPGPRVSARDFLRPPPSCIKPGARYQVTMLTTQGKIVFNMSADEAPATVNNFIVLALDGYYNGLRFWRTEDWVVQGGDPAGDGTGGPGYTLDDEDKPGTKWEAGSVGMARPVNGRINGSQFFFLKQPWPGAGPGGTSYNRFGTVVQGQDIIALLGPADRILSIQVSA